MKKSTRIPIIVKILPKGFPFFGYVDSVPMAGDTTTLYNARAIEAWEDRWSIIAIAQNGVSEEGRLSDVQSYMHCTCSLVIPVSAESAKLFDNHVNSPRF